MKNFFRILSSLLFFMSIFFFAEYIYLYKSTPDTYNTTNNSDIDLSGIIPVSIKIKPKTNHRFTHLGTNNPVVQNGKLTLLNVFPIKTVNIQIMEENSVNLCGTPFGIKLFPSGPTIINISKVNTDYGPDSPAEKAGLELGDVILKINDTEIRTNEDLSRILEASEGECATLYILREHNKLNIQVTPLKSLEDKKYKIGIWVRDSTGGIGTITFYKPSSKLFCGLGHAICDVDTGKIMQLYRGDVMKATIDGVNKGTCGSPGELKGTFTNQEPIGELCENTETGIYGTLKNDIFNRQRVKVAMKHQVKTGSAKILTTLSGENPQCFDVNIESINYNPNNPTKNILIYVTDTNLIQKTGGIVQGMSGSPIIQNGMLVGAVTHVFINQPARGYAIFAETMLTNLNNMFVLSHKKAQ